MRTWRAVIAGTVVVVATVTLSGCGGGDSGARDRFLQLVAAGYDIYGHFCISCVFKNISLEIPDRERYACFLPNIIH